MRGHLSEERFADLLSGDADPVERQHLEACASCRTTLAELTAGWDEARRLAAPEPPPEYWLSFRKEVGARIAAEPRPRRAPPAWLFPALAAACLAIAVFFLPSRSAPPADPGRAVASLPAWSPPPPETEEMGLPALEALDEQAELAEALCHDWTDCLVQLSEDEDATLPDALRQELKGRFL
jgi:DNA-binding transcriptional LysR family regulator